MVFGSLHSGGNAVALLKGLFVVIDHVLGIYLLLIFISVVLKMVRADSYNPLVRGLYVLTDPPARWLTRRFPRLVVASGDGHYIDLGPTVLMVLIGCIKVFLPYLLEFLLSL